MVAGQEDVLHAPRRPGVALPDRLHPGHRPASAPERGGTGRMSQQVKLLRPGFLPMCCVYRTLTLSEETYKSPHQDADNPGRGGPPVC